jgi:ribosomal protein S18 acetylase RimI-like enzyme
MTDSEALRSPGCDFARRTEGNLVPHNDVPNPAVLPEGLRVRVLATDADAEACARLMSTSEPWVTLGRDYARALGFMRDPSREVYVVEHGDRFAGFLILNMQGTFRGYIQTICMAPEMRGRGFGSAVLGWAEARIYRDSPNVFLCVSSFNPAAQRLYIRLGYRVVGELHDFIVRGHAEILLRKTLGPWNDFQR